MNGEINGTFIYNGSPQNGATAKLWKITGFASYADSTDDVQDNPLAATAIELNVSDGSNFAVGDIIKAILCPECGGLGKHRFRKGCKAKRWIECRVENECPIG